MVDAPLLHLLLSIYEMSLELRPEIISDINLKDSLQVEVPAPNFTYR